MDEVKHFGGIVMPRTGHFRALARKRYGRRLVYISGDGPWLLLLKCSGKWHYRLFGDQLDAIGASAKSCGPSCLGCDYHKVWKLVEDPPAKPAPAKASELKTESEDDASFFWEQRLGVEGL